jgi:hypothetical protein
MVVCLQAVKFEIRQVSSTPSAALQPMPAVALAPNPPLWQGIAALSRMDVRRALAGKAAETALP